MVGPGSGCAPVGLRRQVGAQRVQLQRVDRVHDAVELARQRGRVFDVGSTLEQEVDRMIKGGAGVLTPSGLVRGKAACVRLLDRGDQQRIARIARLRYRRGLLLGWHRSCRPKAGSAQRGQQQNSDGGAKSVHACFWTMAVWQSCAPSVEGADEKGLLGGW